MPQRKVACLHMLLTQSIVADAEKNLHLGGIRKSLSRLGIIPWMKCLGKMDFRVPLFWSWWGAVGPARLSFYSTCVPSTCYQWTSKGSSWEVGLLRSRRELLYHNEAKSSDFNSSRPWAVLRILRSRHGSFDDDLQTRHSPGHSHHESYPSSGSLLLSTCVSQSRELRAQILTRDGLQAERKGVRKDWATWRQKVLDDSMRRLHIVACENAVQVSLESQNDCCHRCCCSLSRRRCFTGSDTQDAD